MRYTACINIAFEADDDTDAKKFAEAVKVSVEESFNIDADADDVEEE